MNWQDRITSDPNVCHGKPCIKGTRVMVSVILDNLAAGESHAEIIRSYHIEEEDIQASLRYNLRFPASESPAIKNLSLPAIFAISWCIASYVIAAIWAVRGVDLGFVLFAPVTVPVVFLIMNWLAGNSELPYAGNLELEVIVFNIIVIATIAVLMSMRDDEGERGP